jgi:hypothetical protein
MSGSIANTAVKNSGRRSRVIVLSGLTSGQPSCSSSTPSTHSPFSLGRRATRKGARASGGANARSQRPIVHAKRPLSLTATSAEIELTPDDLREIEDARLEAQGERYPEAAQQMIDR